RRIGAKLVCHRRPMEGEFAGKHVAKCDTEALKFDCLCFAESPVVNQSLKNRQVCFCPREGLGAVATFSLAAYYGSLLIEAASLFSRKFSELGTLCVRARGEKHRPEKNSDDQWVIYGAKHWQHGFSRIYKAP